MVLLRNHYLSGKHTAIVGEMSQDNLAMSRHCFSEMVCSLHVLMLSSPFIPISERFKGLCHVTIRSTSKAWTNKIMEIEELFQNIMKNEIYTNVLQNIPIE